MASLEGNTKTTAYMMETQDVPLQKRRGYLGMSGLGKKCMRASYYEFHWASPQEKLKIRTQRIFARGDLEEARIIAELHNCGFEVFRQEGEERVPLTGNIGERQEELIGFADHARGHPDGRVSGLPELPKGEVALLELKTAKASKFREYAKNAGSIMGGVYHANHVYYGQCQRYMKAMNLKWCLFIVTNKDTEERYYEVMPYDESSANELERREYVIITSTAPPEKLSNNKNWIDCKWCKHKGICHDNERPLMNCRTCQHVDIADNGTWECGKFHKLLSIQDQEVGCAGWREGWGL